MNGARRTLIVGIGSNFGDDRLGLELAERLTVRLPWCKVCSLRSPIDLLDHLADVARLHVIDACCSGKPPGVITRHDWPAKELAEVQFGGTHDLGLIAALQLADQLRMLPTHVSIWAVAVREDAQHGEMSPLSASVAEAVNVLTARIASEVDGFPFVAEEPIHHA